MTPSVEPARHPACSPDNLPFAGRALSSWELVRRRAAVSTRPRSSSRRVSRARARRPVNMMIARKIRALFQVPADNPELVQSQLRVFASQVPLLYYMLLVNVAILSFTHRETAPAYFDHVYVRGARPSLRRPYRHVEVGGKTDVQHRRGGATPQGRRGDVRARGRTVLSLGGRALSLWRPLRQESGRVFHGDHRHRLHLLLDAFPSGRPGAHHRRRCADRGVSRFDRPTDHRRDGVSIWRWFQSRSSTSC